MKNASKNVEIFMIYKKRYQVVLYLILIITSITILGVSLQNLQILPGLPILGVEPNPANNLTTASETSGKETSPQWLFQTSLAVGIILLLALLITAFLNKANIKLVILIVSVLALLIVLFGILHELSIDQFGTLHSEPPQTMQQLSDPNVELIGDPPAEWNFWVTVGLGFLGIIIIGWIVSCFFRKPHKENKLAAEANLAIQSINSGVNLGGIIIKCYLNMEKIISEERGIERNQSMTPYEFEAHLIDIGIPKFPIQVITNMFEKARYGNYHFTEQDELDAVSNLAAIQNACHLSMKKQ